MSVLVQRNHVSRKIVALAVTALMLLALTPVVPVQAISDTTWYVDVAQGDDLNEGTTSAPFKSITAGLAVAQAGDTVMVAPGTYSGQPEESVPLEYSGEVFPLSVPAGVSLVSSDGSWATVIDGARDDLSVSSSEMEISATMSTPLLVIEEADGALVEGFSIINGLAEVGAGAYVYDSHGVTMRDVVFENNRAFVGGGMIVGYCSDLVLEGCAFIGDPYYYDYGDEELPLQEDVWQPNAYIGGGLVAAGSEMSVHDCEFYTNTAVVLGASALFVESIVDIQGGSVTEGYITAEDSILESVDALEGFLALGSTTGTWADRHELQAQESLEDYAGGGLAVLASAVSVNGARFEGNGAPFGGAIYSDEYSEVAVSETTFGYNFAIWGSSIARGSVALGMASSESLGTLGFSALEIGPMFEPSLTAEKCVFAYDDWADTVLEIQNPGGAPVGITNCLFHDNYPWENVIRAQGTAITNSTFAGNSSLGMIFKDEAEVRPLLDSYVGATVHLDAGSTVTNSVLWGNGPDYEYYEFDGLELVGGELVDIDGGHVSYTNAENAVVAASLGDGNISADPLFFGEPRDDYRLRPGSPSIDTGTDDGAPVDDLLGHDRPFDGDFDGTAVTDMGAYEYIPYGSVRTGGGNRYETAVRISSENFDSSDVVIIARGDHFADGLTASGLAGVFDAPVLLTRTKSLPSEVVAEIERLGAGYAIIIGGNAAVDTAVRTQLRKLGLATDRIGGVDRYETSILVAEEIMNYVDMPELFFVVRGDNFPDALTVSPVAYSQRSPIILVKRSEMPDVGASFIEMLSSDVPGVIVGGSDAVSDGIEASLSAADFALTRIAGANRYETSVLFSEAAVEKGWARLDFIGIATGRDFPDALAGGAAIGSWNGVLMLTPRTSLNADVKRVLSDNKDGIFKVEIFGGPAAVAEPVRSAIQAAIQH